MRQLYTIWGEGIRKKRQSEDILTEYPREQMRRESYYNLNGSWDYAFTGNEAEDPKEWDGSILVPFSPETPLSGVGRQLQPDEALWYRRKLPDELVPKARQRVLLHFGGVDQICQVMINGKIAGEHIGGYLPFTVDITEYLQDGDAASASRPRAGKELIEKADEEDDICNTANILTLRVLDLSDASYHARGKQKLQRGGMYYTAQSGIWQTVWAEIVPEAYIQGLQIVPDIDKEQVEIMVKAEGSHKVEIRTVTDEGTEISIAGRSNENLILPVSHMHLWSPEDPYLYPLHIVMEGSKKTVGAEMTKIVAKTEDSEAGTDCVESYFAMRSTTVEKDEKGIPRYCLNHKPIFLRGVLDQGYWPESLYTPPSDEAVLFDLTEMKRFGFNMVRKHAKIESDRWYYHCDRLGLLVWQDMVNGGEAYDDFYVTILPNLRNWRDKRYSSYNKKKTGRVDREGRREFAREIEDTVAALGNHPSVIAWTLFNEGWGQFNTRSCTEKLRKADPHRPIDSASGWFDQGCGDFKSVHNYFFPFRLYTEKKRASVLSEFGGLPMLVPDHSACEKIYGYGKKYTSLDKLTGAYWKLVEQIEAYREKGLCAAVYTQWTDIEDEVNGIYSWDRKVKKIDKE